MKRLWRTCTLVVLAALTTACGFKIFEDIGTDPHPPTVEITSIIEYVAPVVVVTPVKRINPATIKPATSSTIGKSVIWDSGGFTLKIEQLFQIGLTYTDAGGDIVKFRLRDRDGLTAVDFIPIDQTFFTGTSGKGFGPVDGLELIGILGRHRMELWAEDSHGSRSEKVEFTITLTL